MSLQEIAFAGVGFVAPPLINGFLAPMLPAAITGNKWGQYAVKAGIVAGVAWGGSKILGHEAGKFLAIGGITYLVANLIVDFVPQIWSGFGYYNPGRTFAPMAPRRALRAQPGLGVYRGVTTATSTAPSRIDPAARF